MTECVVLRVNLVDNTLSFKPWLQNRNAWSKIVWQQKINPGMLCLFSQWWRKVIKAAHDWIDLNWVEPSLHLTRIKATYVLIAFQWYQTPIHQKYCPHFSKWKYYQNRFETWNLASRINRLWCHSLFWTYTSMRVLVNTIHRKSLCEPPKYICAIYSQTLQHVFSVISSIVVAICWKVQSVGKKTALIVRWLFVSIDPFRLMSTKKL